MSKTANTFSEGTDSNNDRTDEIRDRIFSLIGSEHGNGQAFRRALGIESKNLITEWKSGRSKSFMKYIPQIAEFYGVSADWILGNSDVRIPDQKITPTSSTTPRLWRWFTFSAICLEPLVPNCLNWLVFI